MDESILTTIKKLLGITEDCTDFDLDIIIHINSALGTLTQFNVGPKTGFAIEDDSTTWSDFMGDDLRLSMVKSFVYMRVRLAFDPPTSAALIEALKEQIRELEFRILVTADGVVT